ncbi:MAG TPA: hypothetical protein VMF10_10820 [Candidatus Aquilonibacter sp.]|nr:hypothetical protein [Candidatus Aquilonibacter sp.]
MTNQDFDQSNGTRPQSFTLRDLAAVGFRHKGILSLCFGGMLLGTLLTVLFMPSEYKAQTNILVKRERVDPVVSPEQTTQLQIRDEISEEELNSEIALIESDDVLRQTVTACGLQHTSSLSSYLPWSVSENAKIAKAILRLRSKLKIDPIRKSNLISVSYTSTDPKRAAQVLSALDNAYIEKHLDVYRAPGQLQFFEQETERYRKDLENTEDQLRQFARGQGGVAPKVARDIALQKLNDFNANLQQTRADLAATAERIQDLQKQEGTTPNRLTTQVKEADDGAVLEQLKSTLLTLELKRTELLTKYQPSYRLVQEVDKEIADTRASISSEESKPLKEEVTDQNPTYAWIGTELARAKSDYSSLKAREASLQAIVNVYQQNTVQLEEKDLAQQDLTRTAKTDEDNYLLYLHKREEARMTDALDTQRILNVTVAEAPSVPSLPTDDRWLYGLVGTLLAATVSVAVVFTAEYLDSSLRTPTDIVSELNLPVLAAVPQRNGHNGNGNGRNGHNGNGRHGRDVVVLTKDTGEVESRTE